MYYPALKPNCEKVQTSVMEMEEVLQSALDNMDDELNKIDLWQNDAIAIGETIDQDGEFQDNYDYIYLKHDNLNVTFSVIAQCVALLRRPL